VLRLGKRPGQEDKTANDETSEKETSMHGRESLLNDADYFRTGRTWPNTRKVSRRLRKAIEKGSGSLAGRASDGWLAPSLERPANVDARSCLTAPAGSSRRRCRCWCWRGCR